MESTQRAKLWPWIIGGCSLLVILACIFPLALGAGGILLARQVISGKQAESNLLPVEMTPTTAVLQNIQGWVEVESDQGDWSPAGINQVISSGQHVRTGKLSSVLLVFNDGSQAMLNADAEIAIDELNAQKNGKPRTIVMTQIAGDSTHQVVPNKHSDSRYEVRSPSGAGVAKGTEFQVVVTPQQTAYYYVVEGVVAVSALETTVLVNPGFMTILYTNQPPLVPVQSVAVEGLVSQVGSQWTVAGTTFTANDETVIVGSPQMGDWVMVNGHLDENSQNTADWVILLRRTVTNRFSLTGIVETIEADQWAINGQMIIVSETTERDENIQTGDTVYVKGLVETGGALQAVQIERLDEQEGQPFTFTGIIQNMNGSLLDISGVSITTNETTTLSEGLETGNLVTVSGRIQPDDTWLAQHITLITEDDNEFNFSGELESKDPWKAAGIRFETREDTIIQSDLTTGDLVRVEGVIDPNGLWIATKIERIDVEAGAKMVIIGTVFTIDPWLVSGMALTIAPDAALAEQITVGMLVRVELVLQPDGTWQVIKIEPVSTLVWFPGCMDVIATVVSVDGNQLHLLNWPVVTVAEGATVEGVLAPNSIIRMRVCFDDLMVMKVTYIIIVQADTDEPPSGEDGSKVTVCHKPDGKKGGHTLTISRSALPAHLGHGDYEGSCR